MFELNSSDVQIKKENANVDLYNIINADGQSVLKVNLSEIVDANGDAYIENDWNTFRFEQVGAQNTTDVSAVKPKVYKALLTQTGTAAPTAVVLENTLGGIVWTRSAMGVYTATLSDAFTENKTFILAQCSFGYGDAPIIIAERLSISTVNIATSDTYITGTYADAMLSNASILIEVYP